MLAAGRRLSRPELERRALSHVNYKDLRAVYRIPENALLARRRRGTRRRRHLSVVGSWTIKLDILVSDFDQITIEGAVQMPQWLFNFRRCHD
jgi:hypothetical protein